MLIANPTYHDEEEQLHLENLKNRQASPSYYDDYKFGDEQDESEEEENEVYVGDQFATSIIGYSSVWGGDVQGSYGPYNVLGGTRVYPTHTSSAQAWCPNSTDSAEYIILGYDHVVGIEEVHIYESSCPGSVVKISGKRLDTESGAEEWVVLWQGANTTGTHVARDFAPPLTVTGFKTNIIRIDLHMNGSWTEIDAVKIVGKGKALPPKVSPLCKMYRQILRYAIHTDLTIRHKSSGREMKVLKAIIAHRSAYLQRLIESSENNVIEIDINAPFAVLVGAIDFFYSNFANIRSEHLVDTYILAEQLQVSDLSDFCVTQFKTIVSQKNVLVFYRDAKFHNCEHILTACISFIGENYQQVFLKPDLSCISKRDLIKICQQIAKKQN